MKKQDNKLEK